MRPRSEACCGSVHPCGDPFSECVNLRAVIDERYSRQVLFEGIGREGQERLLRSRVLIVGCGALGAMQAEMLGRAGTGYLRLVDRDFVEFSNLQRQTLYTESDALEKLPKAVAAAARLGRINSGIEVEPVVADVNSSNVLELIEDVDLVLDGTDNFQVRYLLNDACVKTGRTWIYGAAVSAHGTTMTIIPGETPCLRCIFEEMPPPGTSPTCDTAGVIQPVIAMISSVQVTEALKILTGGTAELHRSLVQFDVWRNEWRRVRLRGIDEDCPACVGRNFEFLEPTHRDLFTTLCGRDAVQIRPPNAARMDLPALAEKLRHAGEIKLNEYLLRLKLEDYELTVFRDARAIIKGTDDESVARTVYARYVGN